MRGNALSMRWMTVAVAMFCLSLFLALMSGPSALRPLDALWALYDSRHDLNGIVWTIRLPRVLAAALAGAQFALAGVLTQSILRNPIAEPGTLGITGGACLAATLFVIAGDHLHWSGRMIFALQPLVACLGGMLAAALVIALAWRNGASPRRLVLCGIVVATTAQLLVVAILAGWGQGRVEAMLVWIAGGLYATTWRQVLVLALGLLTALVATPFLVRPAALLLLGDARATGLGLNVTRWRLCALLAIVIITALCVSVVGPVGFIGLVVPQAARVMVGARPARLVLCAPFIGATLAVLADTFGRTAFAPYEMPLGALSALIGVPIFLIEIRRMRG